jgi:hypothetical protein
MALRAAERTDGAASSASASIAEGSPTADTGYARARASARRTASCGEVAHAAMRRVRSRAGRAQSRVPTGSPARGPSAVETLWTHLSRATSSASDSIGGWAAARCAAVRHTADGRSSMRMLSSSALRPAAPTVPPRIEARRPRASQRTRMIHPLVDRSSRSTGRVGVRFDWPQIEPQRPGARLHAACRSAYRVPRLLKLAAADADGQGRTRMGPSVGAGRGRR